MPLPPSAPLFRSDSITFTELDDEVVMLDTRSGQYLELDAVGARIWMLLEDGPSMLELRDLLTAEFDVDAETCLNELTEFVEKLVELKLIVAESSESIAP